MYQLDFDDPAHTVVVQYQAIQQDGYTMDMMIGETLSSITVANKYGIFSDL